MITTRATTQPGAFVTEIDGPVYSYTPTCGPGRQGWRSGFVLSVVLHVLFAVALSFVAVAPRRFLPSFITTALFQHEPGDEGVISLVSPVTEIPRSERVKTSVVSAASLTKVFSPRNRRPNASLPDRRSRSRQTVADVEQTLQDVGSSISDIPQIPPKQSLAEIRSRVTSAGGSSGRIQFSLVWEGRNDLDLHVVAPSGERIFFHHKRSSCSAELDVDMNAQPECEAPVENIHWPKSQAPEGRYSVFVHYYRRHVPTGPVPYRLMIKRADVSQVIDGIASNDNDLNVHRTLYIASHVEGSERAERIRSYINQQRHEEAVARLGLNDALSKGGPNKALVSVVLKYPHTDAAADAIRLLNRRRTQLQGLFEPFGLGNFTLRLSAAPRSDASADRSLLRPLPN
jgi:hypothetical protein